MSVHLSYVSVLGSFNSDSMTVAVHEQNVYLVEPGKVSVRTFQVRNYFADMVLQ